MQQVLLSIYINELLKTVTNHLLSVSQTRRTCWFIRFIGHQKITPELVHYGWPWLKTCQLITVQLAGNIATWFITEALCIWRVMIYTTFSLEISLCNWFLWSHGWQLPIKTWRFYNWCFNINLFDTIDLQIYRCFQKWTWIFCFIPLCTCIFCCSKDI